ncbi:MAG TPA: LuxR C-terminal-related transcriptional regulator [Caulobacteraceae bacterium]|jgi:two-component system response regulator FixJ|nr:LuxR C-terminal-related transcriptional regulator [Caulobacteraceae bacterium]
MRGAGESVVFVVDDVAGDRDSLVSMLRGAGLTSRAYPDAASFLARLDPNAVGCVVAEAHMAQMGAVALIETLRRRGCLMPVIVSSGRGDVMLAVRAMKAGAAEFVQKPLDAALVVGAVRGCLDQAQALNERARWREDVSRRTHRLTLRERQVLSGVVDGRTNKEIGLALGISSRTVEIHRANLMLKMQAEGLSDLVRMVALTDLAA